MHRPTVDGNSFEATDDLVNISVPTHMRSVLVQANAFVAGVGAPPALGVRAHTTVPFATHAGRSSDRPGQPGSSPPHQGVSFLRSPFGLNSSLLKGVPTRRPTM